jgi:adenylate kinase family enzyme
MDLVPKRTIRSYGEGGNLLPTQSQSGQTGEGGGALNESIGDFSRTVVVGNGGSGKSWLAERLAAALSMPSIDLDEIHWLPGGFNARREPATAVEIVRAKAAGERWVIEGVYGWLANVALPRATAFVWLDLPIEECVANVRARGLRRGGDPAAFETLIQFVVDYDVRTNANSRTAHEQAFNSFAGLKARLTSRTEISCFLSDAASAGR